MPVLLLLKKGPMFSSGQITFGIVFFIVFVIIIFFQYKKDTLLHKKNYKNVWYILIGFLSFFLLLLGLKFGLK